MNYNEVYQEMIENIIDQTKERKPLCVGQGDNLILENDFLRVWISRDEYSLLSIEVLTDSGWEPYNITEVE